MARGPKKSVQSNSKSKAPSKAPVANNARTKVQPVKGGKNQPKYQNNDSDDEESYDDSEDENFLALQKKGKRGDSDDEDEQAAFDLNVDSDVRLISKEMLHIVGKIVYGDGDNHERDDDNSGKS